MLELYPIHAGYFTADGGALFSVVPKPLWSNKYPADELNRCRLVMRCLLVVGSERKVLIDTGSGSKYDEKYTRNSGLEDHDSLLKSLAEVGCSPVEITDVFLTHLHWDHCGGAVINDANGGFKLQFPNATHWVAESQWEQSQNPNLRDRNAYFDADLDTLRDSGKLRLISESGSLFPGFDYLIFNGHTPGLILPLVTWHGRKILYAGDLIPVAANIQATWLASYDLFPVTAMEEKTNILQRMVDGNMVLFFEHDALAECAELVSGTKGVTVKRTLRLSEIE